MGAKRLDELMAWQLAREFKLLVYDIVQRSPRAVADGRWKDQVLDAAASGEANVAEGFHRYGAAEFAHFLGIARASIGEAKVRLIDGADRGHFPAEDCRAATISADRAMGCITKLKLSLEPYIKRKSGGPGPGPGPGPGRGPGTTADPGPGTRNPGRRSP